MKKILPFLVVFAVASSALAAKPSITSPITDCGTTGVPYSYQITANQAIISWVAAPLPAGLTVNTSTGLISGTPTVVGTSSIALGATNGNGTGTLLLTLTINAAPTISSLSPTCATAGGPQFTLTVNGTNFVSTSTVKWNVTALTTTFVSSTRLTATVPASLIATAGTASITVASCAATSNAQTFTITAAPVITSPLTACGTIGIAFSYPITATNNPTSFTASPLPAGLSVNTSTGVISGTPTTAGTTNVTITASNGAGPCNTASATLVVTIRAAPTVSSLSPTCATAGGPQFTLTVNGTNFVSGSTVNWNGTPLTTTFVSATQLTATVPASLIASAGTASITVVTPCGGTSNAKTFTIGATPVITSPLTACGTVGVAFSYTITATNNPTTFSATPLPAGLSVNTSTGVISGTPTTGGTTNVTITASNGASSCNSASATLVITTNAVPTISSLSPICTTAGGGQFTLTVNGTNFVSGSTVNWNGTALSASGSSTQLTATVPASLIATAGTASVTVVTPCGGTSNAKTFTIAAPPAITSPLTACGTKGVAFSYQITATNNPTSYSATGLPGGLNVNTSTGVISGTPTATGPFSVTISASNGAGSCNTGSATLVITIGTTPTISSISPTCTAAGGPQFTLTVNGPNNDFTQGETVYWNGSPLVTTFVSSKLLTAIVTTDLIATPGAASITVGGCGATSGAVTFTISAAPAISSLSPTCASEGDIQFTLTVNGINFISTSIVNWNGAALTTTFVSSTQLTATVAASRIALPGTASITVVSPCAGTSNAITFPVDATPSITSALTASATVGTPFSYQITANNNPTSYNATDLPQGLTVDTTTGLISGTSTATGVFPVIISATNNGNDPCSGTATDTLMLTVTFPSGTFIPPFPGQTNLFNWGTTPPSPSATIPFPNASTNNSFVLYWIPPGTNTHPTIIDSPGGSPNSGLQRNPDPVGMKYNHYDPTLPPGTPGATPIPDLNVWRGNPSPPNDNTSGQFSDPRASWYITDPWPTADYVTGSYWGGPNPNLVPLNWPDSGHRFSYTEVQPTGQGQYPTDIMAGTIPTPDPTKSISLLSSSNTGILTSITELGNVWDPAQMTYTVTNSGGPLPDIPTSASPSSRGAGGHTLAIGRPEFSKFDQNRMRAWQLLDVFSARTANTNFTNTAGLVNINTASRDVLRSLAAGILENRDPAIQPSSLQPPPNGNGLYRPTSAANVQADLFADAVINSRPLLSTAALSAIKDSQGRPFFGNPNQYSNQTQPTEWNDAGREELFSKILNLATTRSRNFRVFVTGQALDKNGNVLSTVTKVYQVFIKPNRDPTTGAIISQQVQIKYEGSM